MPKNNDNRLFEFRRIWEQKPVLRLIYQDYYQQIAQKCGDGITLEIGGGSGNLKDYLDNVISTDIQPAPWLDTIADAHKLPFATNTLSNIVMVDVLHHLASPKQFFMEANRVLKPNGNIILLEPAITPISWWFYHFIHQEPVVLSQNPLLDHLPGIGADPYDANQAIPSLLFGRHKQAFVRLFPNLKIENKQWLSLWAYPLSGGFKAWCLLPKKAILPLLKLETALAPFIGPIFGFRLFVNLKKTIP